MNKLGTWWEQRLCNFIGWDYNLLKECGEASHRQLKVYTCAILIIMVIWFTIGYVFSQRYIGVETILGRILSGLVFSIIVFFVERIIILHMGGRGLYFFRLFLAICMAVLGAFIFDQMIFRNDLEKALINIEESKIKATNEKNIKDWYDQIHELYERIDTINAQYKRNPKILSTEPHPIIIGYDSITGKPLTRVVNVPVYTDNKIINQLPGIDSSISANQHKIDSTRALESKIAELAKERYKITGPAFLEELKASIQVIGESWISILFYVFLFAVLLCLELFVVSLKFFKSKDCDYEMIVKHQLDVKVMQLANAKRNLHEKYVTKNLDDNISDVL